MKSIDHDHPFPAQIERTVRAHRMFGHGDSVVVAVSGGPDSVALLRVLALLAPRMDLKLAVAHVDHGLRPDSTADAVFVRDLAADLGLCAYTRRANVRELARSAGVSIEEAGRQCRYAFFDEIRSATGALVTATAHHLDDAVETFFLRLFRGTSVAGLGGIRPVKGSVVRPLVEVYREDIMGFLDDHGIAYRIDETNTAIDAERNFVRNKVLPGIHERFPSFRKTLARTMNLIRQEGRFLDTLTDAACEEIVDERKPGTVTLSLPKCGNIPEILLSRAVVRLFHEIAGEAARFAAVHVRAALKIMASANPSGRLALPGGLRLQRQYDRITLSVGEDSEEPASFEILVDKPDTIEIPRAGMTFHLRLLHVTAHWQGKPWESQPLKESDPMAVDGTRDTGRPSAHRVWFDAEEVPFPLLLRPPRPGDRISPWGMQGTRKLKNLLIDAKVPVAARRSLPLLVKDDVILWVPGIRRSAAAAVTENTRLVLEAGLENE